MRLLARNTRRPAGGRRAHRSVGALLAGLALLAAAPAPRPASGGDVEAALSAITADEIEEDLRYLASSELGGRDSPSHGLELAARRAIERFREAGLVPAPDSLEAWERVRSSGAPPEWSMHAGGTYLRPFDLRMNGLSRPLPSACHLELEADGERSEFQYGVDYVPIAACNGDIFGELVFAGYGIVEKGERYDDLKGLRLRGKVALIFEGEPRHRRRFEGEEVSESASLWNKLEKLDREGVGGVLVVRRPPAEEQERRQKSRDADEAPAVLPYRHTVASWNAPGQRGSRRPRSLPPALAISVDCASRLLGTDAEKVAQKIDKNARPQRVRLSGLRVNMESRTEAGSAPLWNVVGWREGSSAPDEVVVIGAHADHIGIGPRGRIAHGADDNASGTSALLEIAQAAGSVQPERTLCLVVFTAEEDGLIGSREFCEDPPVPAHQLVGMVNLDMLGRGPAREVHALGFEQNPDFEDIVERARKTYRTGVKKLHPNRDESLFRRSDHYSFHRVGVPAVLLFENYPLSEKEDYHTWRDVPDRVDFEKVEATARLAFATAWLLANDAERLPAPIN